MWSQPMQQFWANQQLVGVGITSPLMRRWLDGRRYVATVTQMEPRVAQAAG